MCGAKGHKSRNCTAPLGQYSGKYPKVEQQERPPPQRTEQKLEEPRRAGHSYDLPEAEPKVESPTTEKIPLPKKNWLDPESPRKTEDQASSSSGSKPRRSEKRTEKEIERDREEREDNAELRRLLRGLRLLPGNFKGKAEIEEICEDIDKREREEEED